MNKKLYTACGAMALSLAACSGENGNISGTSTEPNPMALGSSSSVAESSSESFGLNEYDLWNPLAGDYHINTARYSALLSADVRADGYWFWEARGADELEGGQSSIIWPVELGSGADSLSTVIDSCQGICGIASLKNGSMTYQPFASIGFVMARDAANNPTPVDVSDWKGVCITYTSDSDASLVLDLGDSLATVLDDGFAFPSAKLPKAVDEVTRCYSWSYFKIPSWKKEIPDGWGQNTGWRAAKQLVGVMFRIQNEPGNYKFDIKYFGTRADGTPEDGSPASSGSAQGGTPFVPVLEGSDGGLWAPVNDAARVKTSTYSENLWPENVVEDGRWYWNTDEDVGGMSSLKWPVALGDGGSLAPVVESCKGICGEASLKKGASQGNPHVTLGFGIASDAAGEPLPVDVSNWEGLCLEYYSELPIKVELVVNDTSDGLPWVELPVSLEVQKLCYDWYRFHLPNDSIASFEGSDINEMMIHYIRETDRIGEKVENAAKQSISVRLKIEADEDDDYKFGIGAIDKYSHPN